VAPWDRSTPWAAKGGVAGPALLERGLELIEETLGPVDILVNNAGIALKKDALDVSMED
jgi:NAD(P)-dependent dehydrogenase (short-subunit alcohol dehydrogenase family)